MTTITMNLQSGMDSCMRVVSVLRRFNIEAQSLEMKGDRLSITLTEEVLSRALSSLSKCADITMIGGR